MGVNDPLNLRYYRALETPRPSSRDLAAPPS